MVVAGFVLDERGFKMSKSLGNVVDPGMVIAGVSTIPCQLFHVCTAVGS